MTCLKVDFLFCVKLDQHENGHPPHRYVLIRIETETDARTMKCVQHKSVILKPLLVLLRFCSKLQISSNKHHSMDGLKSAESKMRREGEGEKAQNRTETVHPFMTSLSIYLWFLVNVQDLSTRIHRSTIFTTGCKNRKSFFFLSTSESWVVSACWCGRQRVWVPRPHSNSIHSIANLLIRSAPTYHIRLDAKRANSIKTRERHVSFMGPFEQKVVVTIHVIY